jgi:exodeoxyribonuclease VII large subunit
MPLADVILAPSPVQGDEAPMALVRAIQELNETAAPDVILVARGGGSIEDLWAFNDERVVRAVTRSHSPVISGVGHETDFTLVDFAADLRAATPTAAAELATPVTVLDLLQTLMDKADAMEANMMALVERQNALLEGYQTSMRYFSPLRQIEVERQHLDELLHRGNTMQYHRLELERTRLHGVENRLTALNPQAVLERGYAVVMKIRRVVSSRTQVQPGDQLQVRVSDGEFEARVSGKG